MDYLNCPVCGERLFISAQEVFCDNNHRFDRAKQGYINLLLNQQSSSKRHGDDRMMINARHDFLSKGFYFKLADAVTEAVGNWTKDRCTIVDVGCGEGYYTEAVYEKLRSQNKMCDMICLDISKEAVKAVSRRSFPKTAIVASALRLPIMAQSVDVIMSIFSAVYSGEFHRVLKPGGLLLRVVPKERHLIELKKSIYNQTYENPAVEQNLDGFEPFKFISLDYEIELTEQADIDALFRMTPYYYKSSKSDQEKLDNIQSLKTQASFAILLDKKV